MRDATQADDFTAIAAVDTAIPVTGLTEAEARLRLAKGGANEMPEPLQRSMLRLAAELISEPMFLLLLACGAVYMVLGDWQEALMLLGFVFIVLGISFVQRHRSEQSIRALRDLASPRAMAERDGKLINILASELVVGDIIVLSEGDRVPADAQLISVSNLSIDESMLSGEALPVMKQCAVRNAQTSQPSSQQSVQQTEPESVPESAQYSDKSRSYAYAGTMVTSGTARALVVATGTQSALGRIGLSLAGIAPALTPVQQETGRVVKYAAMTGLALATALTILYWITSGDWLHSVLAGLTLAIAVLPEELPLVLSLFLGLGAWRLAREQVLTRQISAVELLGAATVLCVDKTGTLTTNHMTVMRLWTFAAAYDANQAATQAATQAAIAPLQEELHGILEYAVLASHRRPFDPMELAIAEAGRRLLLGTEHLHSDWDLVEDYPLAPDMLAMSRVWQSPDHRELMIASKGAPEAIVDLCHFDAAQVDAVMRQVLAMARDGLRVLGVACATFPSGELPDKQHDFHFSFLGLIALEDPVRADVPQAIRDCQAAGIRVVMLTGDHPATAVSIAKQAGINTESGVISGSELADMDQEILALRLAASHIYCRVQPEQKLRLVRAFQAAGEVVAMTGDGVNDAPALKAADIGVAMGARGTEVAREAAAIVLLRDDFSSLLTAVRYGRRVFANLRKAIVFVIAVHVPIVGLSIIPVMMGWPMVLMPVHILFLQLIIDPACSIVFEAQPLDTDAMKQPPRPKTQKLFDRFVLTRGFWQGLGLMGLLLLVYGVTRSVLSIDVQRDQLARTLSFIVLVLANLALIYVNLSWSRGVGTSIKRLNFPFVCIVTASLVALGLALYVPALTRLFAFAEPTPVMLLTAMAVAGLSLMWFEFIKNLHVDYLVDSQQGMREGYSDSKPA
ncbi:HAD-IC family P-type ATPase [Undibacterium sp. B2R-29]|nr:HAD-IC family P-type ATPase [Undibacterium crateris]